MGKVLSVIVPAYNVEKYIEQCISSLIVEEIMDKLEILVINDGSKDSTARIVEAYCRKYPETCFLFNKENGGHGSGINYGIAHATGKYFKILDGDDWLNTEELIDFIKVLENQSADIVASNFLCVEDKTEKVLFERFCTDEKQQYGKTCYFSKGEINYAIKMHALTIKTELLKKMEQKIDEHCFYVDCEYITYPIPLVESVYYYPKFIYMYRLGRNGQSVDIASMQKNIKQHKKVLDSLLYFYDSLDECSDGKRKYIEKCIGQVVENQFQIYISMGMKKGIRKEMREWDIKLKEKYPAIYSATTKKSITLLRKTNYRALKVGAIVYRIVKR